MSLRDAFKKAGVKPRRVRRGEIYLVKDDLIQIPETRLPGQKRKKHEERPVLVIQCKEDAQDHYCYTTIVAPFSHRVKLKRAQDLELSRKETGLDYDSILRLGLIQPILKVDLSEKPIRRLSKTGIQEVLALLARNVGIFENGT